MFNVWFEGLPAMSEPSTRIKSTVERSLQNAQLFPAGECNDHPFDGVWYSMPMCAATMQHYHMAQILLLINKPHETTARSSTITYRLTSYRDIEKQTVHHCYGIWNVASAQFLLLVPMILVQRHCLFPSQSLGADSPDPAFVCGWAVPPLLMDVKDKRS